eukprot:2119846-Pleurochrysis_carterae.AAC.2
MVDMRGAEGERDDRGAEQSERTGQERAGARMRGCEGRECKGGHEQESASGTERDERESRGKEEHCKQARARSERREESWGSRGARREQ